MGIIGSWCVVCGYLFTRRRRSILTLREFEPRFLKVVGILASAEEKPKREARGEVPSSVRDPKVPDQQIPEKPKPFVVERKKTGKPHVVVLGTGYCAF
jgi:hypothetical protein